MNKYWINIILWIFLLLIYACNKDTDPVDEIPAVKILSPVEYDEYNVRDTIPIHFRVDNDQAIDEMRIQLHNNDFIPVLPSVIIKDLPPRKVGHLTYRLSDTLMETDTYKLRFESSINKTASVEWLSIFVNKPEPPKILQSIWLITEKTSTSTSIEVKDPDFGAIHSFTFEGNYAGSDISSTNQQFYIAGSNRGDLTAYNTQTYETDWLVPIVPNPVQPYFTALRYVDEILYVGFWDGNISGFNKMGTSVVEMMSSGTSIPYIIQPAGKYLVSAAKQRSNVNQWWMNVNYLDAGGLFLQQPIGISPVILTLTNDENILLYSNDANGLFSIYMTEPASGNVFIPWFPYVLPSEKLICAKDMKKEQLILSTDNGIYVCKHQSHLAKINIMNDVNILEYEEASKTLYAVSGNVITTMDMQGNIISQLPQEDEILNIHFLYNR